MNKAEQKRYAENFLKRRTSRIVSLQSGYQDQLANFADSYEHDTLTDTQKEAQMHQRIRQKAAITTTIGPALLTAVRTTIARFTALFQLSNNTSQALVTTTC